MNLFKSFTNAGGRPKLLLNAFALLALVNPLTNAMAANPEVSISQAESVTVSQLKVENQTRMSFSGFGQTFNLLMQKNDALMKNYSSRLIGIELYAGTIEGVHGSWARITKVNGEYTGAIYDGYELYLLDSGKMAAESVDVGIQSAMKDADTVIYKASGVTTGLTCGANDNGHAGRKFSYQNLVSELRDQQAALQGQDSDNVGITATATRQVNLSIVADTQYAASSPNGAQAQVLSQMNIVDGIFSEQVGVQFGITDIQVLNNNGGLTSTSSGTLLRQFRTFIGNNNPGLSHLFTGRDLDGSVIGVAFVGTICTTSGVGVTQAGGRGTFGALTAAHEFGHNYGAPHDNQGGSACASTPGNFLMNPSLNGSDQFSQCSLQQIDDTLRVRSACLVDVDTPNPDPDPVSSCEGSTDFATGANGFSFIDDAQTPAYSASSQANGALNIVVGGVDNADISNMEGSWQRRCEADTAGPVTIQVSGSMLQASEYESNEFSQIALRVNGEQTVLATLTGDGNGGQAQSTGAQTFSVNTTLDEGINVIDLVCFNNLKTFNNESTRCSFSSIDVGEEVPDVPTPTEDLINENFDNSIGDFSFEDDPSSPLYADGERASQGGVDGSGALTTLLGGVDNADISDIEASWVTDFSAPDGQVTLTLDANLVQASDYEANEFSEVGIKIDGQESVLNRVTGNGNGGGQIGTGFQRYTLDVDLSAGPHRLTLFCRNSEKTFNNEETRCTFDNVVLK